ncbi:hypothetical protein SGPA1_31152 [Streptomyces misionensis JCM 4497]
MTAPQNATSRANGQPFPPQPSDRQRVCPPPREPPEGVG